MSSNPVYHTVIQPPPGNIVAPNGFPANPRPIGAPKPFLDAMDIRITVFCDEQHCAIEPELDEDDAKSWSWIVYQQEAQTTEPADTSQDPDRVLDRSRPVATLRIVPPPHPPHPNGFHDSNEKPYIKVTRVATVKDARGRGLNKKLILDAMEWLSQPKNAETLAGKEWNGSVLTHAQVDVEKFYEKLGFVTDQELGRWDEVGIEHIGMWKKLEIKS